jgi:hypothetical protein
MMAKLTMEELKKIYNLYAKKNGYTETPTDILNFISDPYYLGDALDGGRVIFPFWKEKLVEIFPTPFYENNKGKVLILSGATGIGRVRFLTLLWLMNYIEYFV